ncbi:hypothetical protein HanOQP8_Chr04g0164311 [Helianthus annuus]|nr:hypothetical protein HanLR1_Chr04g0157241 [Helianthus annuus]KAJ0762705.1 hypothetical protein HanOQP8_Chr04g0164311 [Helianthus annuus]
MQYCLKWHNLSFQERHLKIYISRDIVYLYIHIVLEMIELRELDTARAILRQLKQRVS